MKVLWTCDAVNMPGRDTIPSEKGQKFECKLNREQIAKFYEESGFK